MQDVLGEVRDEAAAVSEQVSILIKNIQILPFEARDKPLLGSTTIGEIVLRASQVEGLSQALAQEPNDKFSLVPLPGLAQFREKLRSFRTQTNQVNLQFDQVASWGGFARVEVANFHMYATNGNAVDIGSSFKNLAAQMEQALDGYFEVAPIARARPILRFGAAARIVQESAEAAAGISDKLEQTLALASKHLKQLEANRNAASNDSDEVSRLLGEAEKSRRTIEENEQKAATASSKIVSVLSDVESLEAQVGEYDSNFKAFQIALEQREKSFREGNDTLAILAQKLKEKDAEISDLIAKANEMLSGATV